MSACQPSRGRAARTGPAGSRLIFLALLGAALLASSLGAPARALDRIYLVRHAEKLEGWPDDRTLDAYWPLSAAGNARAAKLAQVLAKQPIAVIYASPTTRALATGLPLAQAVGCPLLAAAATTDSAAMLGFLSQVVQQYPGAGQSVLIVGHSNTIPMLLHALGASAACDSSLGIVVEAHRPGIQGYDGLWEVDLRGKGCARFRREVLR